MSLVAEMMHAHKDDNVLDTNHIPSDRHVHNAIIYIVNHHYFPQQSLPFFSTAPPNANLEIESTTPLMPFLPAAIWLGVLE